MDDRIREALKDVNAMGKLGIIAEVCGIKESRLKKIMNGGGGIEGDISVFERISLKANLFS